MAITIEVTETSWNNKIRWFIAASLLLHVLLLFLFGKATDFKFFEAAAENSKENEIVFEFEPSKREIVETPEESNTDTPQDTPFASDKNMTARNPEETENLSNLPFNPGQTEFAEVPTPALNNTQEASEIPETTTDPADESTESKETSELELEEMALNPSSRRSFSRDLLTGKQPAVQPQSARPSFENKEFSVEDLGGFAFNTYNWNFAPYMLYLKKHVQRHIFPPPAFSKMGIIEGRSVLRFLIDKDGSLIDIKILGTEGHQSLLETSTNAINSSAPFKPLPSGFPEDYLEVTGTFVYSIYR